MELAYLTTHTCLDPVEPPSQTIQDAFDQVTLLDQIGFDMIWYPEHHFIRSYTSPSPLLGAVAAAERIKRARIGTSVILAPLHHPLTLAGNIAYADHLTGGRLEIGFARGSSDYELARFQLKPIEAAERMRECVEAVLGLLGSENFTFEGKHWRFPETTIVPRPLQQPFPKMWVASRSPETVQFTIERQLGMMLTVQQEAIPRLRAQIALVDALVDELEDYPRPPISVSRMMYVSKDKADVHRAMEAAAYARAMNFHMHHDDSKIIGGHGEMGPLPEGYAISPEELGERLVVGDPETVIEKLSIIEDMGVDQFVVYADWGQPQSDIMRSLELFATDVMPYLKRPSSENGTSAAGAALAGTRS